MKNGGGWTIEMVEENIKQNIRDYGSMICAAYLFKKIYGRLPRIGLSGAQAEYANGVCDAMLAARAESGVAP